MTGQNIGLLFFFHKYFMSMYLLCLWNDFFAGSVSSTFQNTRITTYGSNNFYLLDSIFILLTTSSTGGAITLTSLTLNLLIEKTSFYSCNSDSDGGGVYFNCPGSCVFNLICGEKCYGHHGSLLFCLTSNSLKNEAHFLSCVRCPNSLTLGVRYSLYFDNGFQNLKNVNSSLNSIRHQAPGIAIYNPNSVSSVFCTFSNTQVQEAGITIWLSGGSGSRILSQWNVVSNGCTTGWPNVYDGSGYTMSHCIFKDNLHILFSSGVTVEYSRIIHLGTIGTSNIISSNTSQTNTFIIIHFSSENCHAENKFAFPTIKETPINTQPPPRTYMDIPSFIIISCKISSNSFISTLFLSILII